jgi:hypothetical protein
MRRLMLLVLVGEIALLSIGTGAGHAGHDVIAGQNAQLNAAHKQLVTAMAATRDSHPLHIFDDPAALAGRPRPAVELGTDLPVALHRFASVCAWAAAMALAQ